MRPLSKEQSANRMRSLQLFLQHAVYQQCPVSPFKSYLTLTLTDLVRVDPEKVLLPLLCTAGLWLVHIHMCLPVACTDVLKDRGEKNGTLARGLAPKRAL